MPLDLGGTLKEKHFGVPTWVIAIVGVIAMALYLKHRKANAPADSTKAAADQTNSDLGSASQLANEFWQAGIMPFMGGDVYVTQTNTNNPAPTPGTPVPTGPGPKPPPPKAGGVVVIKPPVKPSTAPLVYRVKKGDTLDAIAKRYGLSWKQLYTYNISTGAKGANRPASTIATLKSRGPDYLVSNEEIDIPKKGTVYAGGF